MMSILARLTLAVSGALLGVIGGALMFTPQAFLRASHVMVARDPGLMSELTAPSGVLVLTGALMVLGALRLRFFALGMVGGAMVYGSYGVGRLISMALHGIPSQSLVAATLVELVIAFSLSVLFLKSTSQNDRTLASVASGEASL